MATSAAGAYLQKMVNAASAQANAIAQQAIVYIRWGAGGQRGSSTPCIIPTMLVLNYPPSNSHLALQF
jgi:hypothetical protein